MNFSLSAAGSVCAQIIPVDTVTTGAQFYVHLSFTLKYFGRPYSCYSQYVLVQFDNNNLKEKKKPNKHDCNIESCVYRCNLYCVFYSIQFDMCNVRLYITFCALLSWNLYNTSCVLNLSSFFVHELFW